MSECNRKTCKLSGESIPELGDGPQFPPPRTDKDYAIEHGGYLADAVMQYLTAHSKFDEKESTSGCDQGDADLLNDCRRALINAIGEFRKRAKRAESGAAQEVSPTCPLCKKSNHFMRQPGTCSHPFHDEPFRKSQEEVSPPSPEPPIADIKKISATPANTVFTEDALGNSAEGDTRELKAALRRLTENFFPKVCTHDAEPGYCDCCRHEWEIELDKRKAEAQRVLGESA